MIQRFTSLPLALRVLIVVGALGAVLILTAGIPTIATNTFERFSSFLGGEGSQQVNAPKDTSGEDEYLTAVEDIQTKSVDSFLDTDDKFSHFDSITPDDLEKMKTDYDALGDSVSQVGSLDPPDRYKGQYELFRLAITELYQAVELAYSLASDPGSLTRSSIDEYQLRVDRAASLLQQSNQSLGQNYKTIKSEKGNLTGSSTTTIEGTTVAQLFDGSKERYVNVHAQSEGAGVPPGIACADLAPTTGTAQDEGSEDLELTPSRDSRVSGTATFEDTGGGVEVKLNVRGPLEGGAEHLAHIHEGATCEDERNDKGGPVEFPLESVKINSP
jgi:hypothetical protein